MGVLKVKPIVTLTDNIIPPTGVQKDAISPEDLKNYPEKYIYKYGHYYANKDELLHEISTRSNILNQGKQSKVVQKKALASKKGQKVPGITYNVLTKGGSAGNNKNALISKKEAYKRLLKSKNR